MIMTRPVWNQLFKELTMLCSKSGGMLVPVRYLNLACQLFRDFSCLMVLCLCTFYSVLQVVLVTDGSLGIGKGSLRNSLQTLKHRGDDKKFPLPFPFPTKLYIMCVANAEEVSSSLPFFNFGEMHSVIPVVLHFQIIFFCLADINSYFCVIHPAVCVVAVTDEWYHEQLGGAPPSQWRWWADIHCRWGTLYEECTGNVWVWLWENIATFPWC